MDARPGSGPSALRVRPTRTRTPRVRRSRTTVRPTAFGVALLGAVLVSGLLRPPVADPSVAGLVWAGLLGALVLGLTWPVLALRLLRVRVVDAPNELVEGALASLTVELEGRATGLSLSCTGSGVTVVDVVAPGHVRLPLVVRRRGQFSRLRVTIGSDAPFGLLTALRTQVLDLPRPLLVGPTSDPTTLHPEGTQAEPTDQITRGAGSTGDSVRSVRPYASGDPAHLVHWPSSARTGELVVREMEPPTARAIALVVDLTAPSAPGPIGRTGATALDGAADAGAADAGAADAGDVAVEAVEAAARRAAGAAEVALSQGARVLLCTAQADGPAVAEVADLRAVRRRLALAVGGAVPAPPEGWQVERITASGSGGDATDQQRVVTGGSSQ